MTYPFDPLRSLMAGTAPDLLLGALLGASSVLGRAGVTSYLAWLSSDKLFVVKSFAVLLTSLLIPSTLFAWGGDGHQIVALIAEERLTSEAQAGIHELLGKDVNISDAEIASWADNIRRESPDTAPWHFVDIPTTQPCFDRNAMDAMVTT